jgi:predicted metal-dependent peptidase
MSQKLLICIYTNKDRNEFAIGLKKDENFRAMTKVDEFYTKFVDAFEQIIDEKEIDWKHELKRWIATAKKNETIFVEVDLSGYNNEIADLSSPEA